MGIVSSKREQEAKRAVHGGHRHVSDLDKHTSRSYSLRLDSDGHTAASIKVQRESNSVCQGQRGHVHAVRSVATFVRLALSAYCHQSDHLQSWSVACVVVLASLGSRRTAHQDSHGSCSHRTSVVAETRRRESISYYFSTFMLFKLIIYLLKVCQEGLRNLNLRFMFFNLVYPVVVCLGTTLAVPHILAKSVAPVLISDEHYLNLIERRIYPTSLFIITVTTILMLQVKQFKRLYERIRNDKYLVGQRLINFERNLVPASSSHRSSPTTGHSPNQSNLFAAQPENLHYD